jgi:hypothetical protein
MFRVLKYNIASKIEVTPMGGVTMQCGLMP